MFEIEGESLKERGRERKVEREREREREKERERGRGVGEGEGGREGGRENEILRLCACPCAFASARRPRICMFITTFAFQ